MYHKSHNAFAGPPIHPSGSGRPILEREYYPSPLDAPYDTREYLPAYPLGRADNFYDYQEGPEARYFETEAAGYSLGERFPRGLYENGPERFIHGRPERFIHGSPEHYIHSRPEHLIQGREFIEAPIPHTPHRIKRRKLSHPSHHQPLPMSPNVNTIGPPHIIENNPLDNIPLTRSVHGLSGSPHSARTHKDDLRYIQYDYRTNPYYFKNQSTPYPLYTYTFLPYQGKSRGENLTSYKYPSAFDRSWDNYIGRNYYDRNYERYYNFWDRVEEGLPPGSKSHRKPARDNMEYPYYDDTYYANNIKKFDKEKEKEKEKGKK